MLAGEHAFNLPDIPGNDDAAESQQQATAGAAAQQQQQQQATSQTGGQPAKKRGRKPKAAQQQQQQQQNSSAKKQQQDKTRQKHDEAAQPFTFTFSAYDKSVLDMMPAYVQQQVPFLTTAKGAIDVVLLQLLKLLAVSDVGFSNLVNRLSELHHWQYYKQMLLYYSFAQHLNKVQEEARGGKTGHSCCLASCSGQKDNTHQGQFGVMHNHLLALEACS